MLLVNALATAVLLAELGILIRYRLARRRQERPRDWPDLTDFRYSHVAAALGAAAIGWAITREELTWGSVTGTLFIGVILPAAAALAATVLWNAPAAWLICLAGGFTSGLALS
ncbi:hypothetical protein NX794_29075 [Streptomyces sp. LP11]|uniref:Integral membrane protein n=1 Tax=Streptomyces pyxinicus TaxID=2970331 RepID=A0ABT2B9N5_9ACTN|nr:hypothetical protein [Streptomyces sp. LP11]MCS0605232.1 hypothetical protein [Streptomyces sp. LP11]